MASQEQSFTLCHHMFTHRSATALKLDTWCFKCLCEHMVVSKHLLQQTILGRHPFLLRFQGSTRVPGFGPTVPSIVFIAKKGTHLSSCCCHGCGCIITFDRSGGAADGASTCCRRRRESTKKSSATNTSHGYVEHG